MKQLNFFVERYITFSGSALLGSLTIGTMAPIISVIPFVTDRGLMALCWALAAFSLSCILVSVITKLMFKVKLDELDWLFGLGVIGSLDMYLLAGITHHMPIAITGLAICLASAVVAICNDMRG